MQTGFNNLIEKVNLCGKKRIAVAVAQDEQVLMAIREAKKRGIADAILVGDEEKIRKIAADIAMDPEEFEIIHIEDYYEAALKAVALVSEGQADMYMKGVIDTKSFLQSILDKQVGLRTGRPLSHVSVFELHGREQLLFLTDVAFVTYPGLDEKVHLIENAVEVARACGIDCPKVAPLAAVEVVNPKMQCTVEAAELTKMCEDGVIQNCIIDGPLSFDLATDPAAASHKGAESRKIVGDADILLFPDIHSGNMIYKCLVHNAEVKNGCVLTGTKAPVILTSRSDSFETKVNSIALAAILADNKS